MLLAHARQDTNLSFPRQFLDAIHIAYLISAPDQGDRLRSQSLNLQQLQHRGVVFLQKLGVYLEASLTEEFLQIQ